MIFALMTSISGLKPKCNKTLENSTPPNHTKLGTMYLLTFASVQYLSFEPKFESFRLDEKFFDHEPEAWC